MYNICFDNINIVLVTGHGGLPDGHPAPLVGVGQGGRHPDQALGPRQVAVARARGGGGGGGGGAHPHSRGQGVEI